MRSLELKVPPPVVAVLLAAAMAGASWRFPGLQFRSAASAIVAVVLAVGALAFFVPAVFSFLRHRTTIDPRKPERTTTLMTSGVYRWSRNPIYLGDALLLLAWAAYLAHPFAFLLVPVFVAWMNAFQIRAEERILRQRFGAPYDDYCRRVGRWITVAKVRRP